MLYVNDMYVMLNVVLSLILGSLVDFLKTPEGCAIPINTLIDMAAQVGCT